MSISNISQIEQSIRLLNLFLSIGILISNSLYAYHVKTIWRWIKVAYAINGLITGIITFKGLLGYPLYTSVEQLLLISLLLLTIFSGTIVSYAKIRVANFNEDLLWRIVGDTRQVKDE